jgi:hypothetical protein
MPSFSSDPERSADAPGAPVTARAPLSRPAPSTLAGWLQQHVTRLAQEWSEELRARGLGHGAAVERVVDDFIRELTAFLPALLGPRGKHLQPLWTRACELFGAIAAKRGLAAGEVIEEFQILRELVIRQLYEDPPRGGAPSLREVLRLNRIADRGITHASVGHTDTMFFQLLGASGTPVGTAAEEIAREADAQLALIREEVEQVLGEPLGAPLRDA